MSPVIIQAEGLNTPRQVWYICVPNGIKTEEEVNSEEHKLKIKKCLRCQESNSPTSSFCSR